jgi:hypothetical protein
LNFPKLKSLTTDAELPYFPIIPTPIWAYYIIPTSFPPSPIAKTTAFICFLTNRTIEAFSFGELLQNMTVLDLSKIDAYMFMKC